MMSQPKPCQTLTPNRLPFPAAPSERDDERITAFDEEVLDRPRRPPAAAGELGIRRPSKPWGVLAADGVASSTTADRPKAVRSLFLLTLLSAVDGSLLALAASGHLRSLGSAIAIGLTVIAGAGSWLAAHQAFAGRRRTARDYASLAALGILTVTSTVVSVWLGTAVGAAVTLHVLPKAAGVILLLVAADVGGLRLPRAAGVPLPLAVLGAAGLAEVALQWTP